MDESYTFLPINYILSPTVTPTNYSQQYMFLIMFLDKVVFHYSIVVY